MKTKKAFSIPEILIVITITGIISVLMLHIVKPTEKYIPYSYYNAYYTLTTAAYNIAEDAQDKSSLTTVSEEDKVFPGEVENVDATTAAKELCKKLAVNRDAANEEERSYGYLNTAVYNCKNNFKTVNTSGADNQFKKENVAFKSSNSMNFYITPLQKMYVKDPLNSNVETEIKYFIVWVDMNAERNPNSAIWKGKKLPDIVPFIVLTDGTILPAGYPTTNAQYLTAHVQYPTSSVNQFSPSPRPYYDSVIAAYNGNEYPVHDVYSLFGSFQKELSGTAVEIKNYTPYTTTYDEECKVDNTNDAPICTIVIDERKK